MDTQEIPDDIVSRHRKERKDLQAKIQALKKTAIKGDKKKKKEVHDEITKLESEMDKRHEEELVESNNPGNNANVTTVTDSLNNLSVQCEDGDDKSKLSKAQRRRDKKQTQLKERELRIAEQEVQNLQGARHLETQQINDLLKKRGLMLHHIPSDGNCLYCAVEHQLRRVKGEAAGLGVTRLRQLTSEHLRQNMSEFLPFLSHPDTGEIFTESQFHEYCDQVESTPAWGGQVELRALSHALKCCIEVVQAAGPPVVLGAEYPPPPLLLTYHRHMYNLGEHYNSVTDYASDDEAQWNGEQPSPSS